MLEKLREKLVKRIKQSVGKARIICFVAIKGGVGKTTLAILFAQLLAWLGMKVLLIDKDHQCNLSHYYDIFNDMGTVSNIYTGNGEVDIVNVDTNIDLIPGSMRLDVAERQLETNPNQNMMFYDWLDYNYGRLELNQYDYIIIDCRPDFGIATRNAIAVSHAIISPVIPHEFSKESKVNLELQMENYRKTEIARPSKESLITAKLFFLANMIKHTKASKSLLSELADDDSVLGQISHKELFMHSVKNRTIIDMACEGSSYRKDQKFFDETFNTVLDVVEQIASL